MDVIQRFCHRLYTDWLPTYCHDDQRTYDPIGFKAKSIKVSEADARDCMVAIDQQVVIDTGGGRFSACKSSAKEVLFWEGHKTMLPRPITLWLEPVITFAALARLHVTYAWPKQSLGMQPKGWAFDLAAYEANPDKPPRILGEVKKSRWELHRLRDDLLTLSTGAAAEKLPTNSTKKWHALLETKPRLLWLVGPNEESYAYATSYTSGGCKLQEVNASALAHSAASYLSPASSTTSKNADVEQAGRDDTGEA